MQAHDASSLVACRTVNRQNRYSQRTNVAKTTHHGNVISSVILLNVLHSAQYFSSLRDSAASVV